jgi:hypothetical protein
MTWMVLRTSRSKPYIKKILKINIGRKKGQLSIASRKKITFSRIREGMQINWCRRTLEKLSQKSGLVNITIYLE